MFTGVCWLTCKAACVSLCFSNTHSSYSNRKKSFKCHVSVFSYCQVQAMNEVSALSPFPARYTSINFTTSQSGEHRTEDETGEMKEKRCSDADICGYTVSWCVCQGFFPSFLSFSLSLLHLFCPVLWTGGCPGLQYPVRSHYIHCGGRLGQMRDGKTKRLTEQDESR